MKIVNFLMIGVLIIGAVLLASCDKENTYNLRLTNTSNNPYLVEVDGKSNTISGNKYKDYKLKKGTYSWKATQQSGYAFYPTEKSGTVNLNQDLQIVFP